MKIRITGAQRETYWYADKIGEVFTVIRESSGGYGFIVAYREPGDCEDADYYVSIEDCEIVTDEPAVVTVLPDESLGGVLREYREVKRKAAVGERIKITADRSTMLGEDFKGTVHTVKSVDCSNADTDGKWSDGSTLNPDHDDYVVLEPSDILVIDGARYRMVDRVAAVGERVIITNAELGYGYKQGGVYVIMALDCDDPCIWPDGTYMSEIYLEQQEYRVLEPVETAATPQLSELPASDQIAENIAALAARVSGLEAKVAEMMRPVNERVNPAELSMSKSEVEAAIEVFSQPIPPQKTAQQIRDEIVERAKADVKTLLDTQSPIGHDIEALDGAYINYHPHNHRVEFVVNRDKRTVVALVWHRRTDKLRLRGIAKCAPGDVFNAHIGRAIALRRALGLEVPAEYLSVPNPEEVRVGDVVEIISHAANPSGFYDIGDIGRVVCVDEERECVTVEGTTTKERRRSRNGYLQIVNMRNIRIISREEVAA
ncbi:hypothetical protein NYE48_27940 [Paenibacillus sp. FSL M7-1455]|uniref:hypothetical protein n=1 Tax=Paenibacillus sp. FSL M7-1455 TaxID=2975316 RepID=UPI0030F9F7DF